MKVLFSFVVIAVAALPIGCVARAEQPGPMERASIRAVAVEAHFARADGGASPAQVAAEPACAAGLVAWQRAQGVSLCAAECRTDEDCGFGERCRVLHADGLDQGPTSPPTFADDVPELWVEYDELSSLSASGLLEDEPPVCEGECVEWGGDLSGTPSKPIALCDPFAAE